MDPNNQFSAAPQPSTPSSGEDPGRTMGVIGLVLSIVFPLIGLIVSIIANNKSKKAGFKNSLAVIGIWIGAIFVGLAVIGIVIGFIATLAASGSTSTT